MLDPRTLRDRPEVIENAVANRGAQVPLKYVLDTDRERRQNLQRVEELKAQRNRFSEQVAQAKRQKLDASVYVEGSRKLGDDIKQLEANVRTLEESLGTELLKFPNIPHASVPVGRSA